MKCSCQHERTLDSIREEANELIKGLKFTVDCRERNGDGRCPMLDLKVWKEIGNDPGVKWQLRKQTKCV